MNWKFWTWPRQLREEKNTNEQWRRLAKLADKECEDLKKQRDAFRREMDELMAAQTRSGALLHRLKDSPMDRPAILAVLAEVTEGTQWWRAVLTLIEEEAQAETTGALAPDLSNDLRNVRAGRAAALLDLKDRLVQKWAALQKT